MIKPSLQGENWLKACEEKVLPNWVGSLSRYCSVWLWQGARLREMVHFPPEAWRSRSQEFVWYLLLRTFYSVLWWDASLSIFNIFYMPGTSDLLLLIFPTHEVGVISLQGHSGGNWSAERWNNFLKVIQLISVLIGIWSQVFFSPKPGWFLLRCAVSACSIPWPLTPPFQVQGMRKELSTILSTAGDRCCLEENSRAVFNHPTEDMYPVHPLGGVSCVSLQPSLNADLSRRPGVKQSTIFEICHMFFVFNFCFVLFWNFHCLLWIWIIFHAPSSFLLDFII